jgi:hypothetical protein
MPSEERTMPWFWQVFLLLVFVVPVITLFAYGAWDIIRRHDIGVAPKALWLIAFCVVPLIGPLIYLVIRPPGTTNQERALAAGGAARTDELMNLADLHDRGKLTDQEFEHAKAQHIDFNTSTGVHTQQISGMR